MISQRLSCSRSSSTDDDSDHEENQTVVRRTSSSRKKSYKKWTKEEDERLKSYIQMNGGMKDWSRISQYVGNGRTDAQCQHRWERFLDPSITKGPWTDEEDRKVIELVRDYGARQWSLIAKELKGRVGKQCRERWHNHLNPAINKNPWTNDENLLLFILHQHFGNRWAEIARHFNGRSDNSIKNHWNSSMKKKFETEVANLKRQGLEWTALIPPDFSWPNLEKTVSTNRAALNTITNRTNRTTTKKVSMEKSDSILGNENKANIENILPVVNSKIDLQQYFSSNETLQPLPPSPPTENQRSEQNLDTIFYCTPPSPGKPLPMLSSCADFTPPNHESRTDVHLSLFSSNLDFYPSNPSSLPTFHCLTSPSLPMLSPETAQRNLFSNDDPFSLHYSTNIENHHLVKLESDHLLLDLPNSPHIISNASSPSKNRVLNTPERLLQPHQIRSNENDWFTDLLTYPEQTIETRFNENDFVNKENSTEEIAIRKIRTDGSTNETKRRGNYSRNLFQTTKKLREELGYDPSYREILVGQTRDQLIVTEQARRYLLTSSSMNQSI